MASDIPTDLEDTPPPIEEFRQFITNEMIANPKLMFAALDGDRVVSFTRLEQSLADPTKALTGFSGTVRTHRRRNIVTAVKAANIRAAHHQGIRQIMTENLKTNPMLTVNTRLGFQPAFEMILFRKSSFV